MFSSRNATHLLVIVDSSFLLVSSPYHFEVFPLLRVNSYMFQVAFQSFSSSKNWVLLLKLLKLVDKLDSLVVGVGLLLADRVPVLIKPVTDGFVSLSVVGPGFRKHSATAVGTRNENVLAVHVEFEFTVGVKV